MSVSRIKAGRCLVLLYIQSVYSLPGTQELLNKYVINDFSEYMSFLSPNRLCIAQI